MAEWQPWIYSYIWEDNWLPNQNGHKVWSSKLSRSDLSLVSHLIKEDSPNWNTNLIKRNFLHFEAQKILQIPLLDTSQQDSFMWGGTKDRRYTVRSGYQQIKTWKTHKEDAAKSSLMKSDIWNKVWSLCIPTKQTVLLWKTTLCWLELISKPNLV